MLKKTLNFIFLLIYVIGTFSAFLVSPQKASADSKPCTIDSADLSALNTDLSGGLTTYVQNLVDFSNGDTNSGTTLNYSEATPPTFKAVVNTYDCSGQKVKINIRTPLGYYLVIQTVPLVDDVLSADDITQLSDNGYTSSQTATLTGVVGDNYCDNNKHCAAHITASIVGGTESLDSDSGFSYTCDGTCNKLWQTTSDLTCNVTANFTISKGDFTTSPSNKAILDVSYHDDRPPRFNLFVTATHCSGTTADVSILAKDVSVALEKQLPLSTNTYGLLPGGSIGNFYGNLGENGCDSNGKCVYLIKTVLDGKTFYSSTQDTIYGGEILSYSCDGTCDTKWKAIDGDQGESLFYSPTCRITSAQFDLNDPTKNSLLDDAAALDTTSSPLKKWYTRSGKDSIPVSIDIKGDPGGCAGQSINVSVFEDRHTGAALEQEAKYSILGSVVALYAAKHFSPLADTEILELSKRPYTVPASGNFSITLLPGQENCVQTDTAQCRYYIKIYDTNNNLIFSSQNTPHGFLAYNCEGDSCPGIVGNAVSGDDYWTYVSDTSSNPSANTTTLQGAGATDSCTGKTDDCYQLYGGLSDLFGALGTKLSVITQATSLSAFLNGLIAVAIGIAGVIAVVRIMYLGVIYMKTDKVTEKLTVRGAIIQTVGGFILLLLVYTILRTINPDLLNLTPNFSTVTIIPPSNTQPSPAGTDTSGADTATSVTNVYIPARDQQLPNAPIGLKALITAHTLMEGFSPKTVTYITNNPGNIGTQINNPNVNLSSVTCPSGLSSYQTFSGNGNNWGCYPTLGQGIQGQANLAIKAASGTVSPYKIGGSNGYDGSLAEYLNLYEHGTTTADTNSTNYLNYFIKYFAQNGVTITGQTPLSQIVNGTKSS